MKRLSIYSALLHFCMLGCDRPQSYYTHRIESGSTTIPEAGSATSEAGSVIRFEVPIYSEAGSVESRSRIYESPPPNIETTRIKPSRLTPEQRRQLELSAIQASRTLYPIKAPVDDFAKGKYFWDPHLKQLNPNDVQLTHETICDANIAMVLIYPKPRPLKQTFQTILDVNCPTDFGISIYMDTPLDGALELLERDLPAAKHVTHLRLGGDTLTAEACETISRLTQLRSIAIQRINSGSLLQTILKNRNLESIEITSSGELTTDCIKQLASLPNLKRIELNASTDTKQVEEFYLKISSLEQLEALHVKSKPISRNIIHRFLIGGDHRKLRHLSIANAPLDVWTCEGFDRIPNLETLQLNISTDTRSIDFLISAVIRSGSKNLKSLVMTISKDEHGNQKQLRSSRSLEFLRRLTNLTELEQLEVPIYLERPSHLHIFTQFGKLRNLPVSNIDLDRETLAYLCQMPNLQHLSVNSLKFENDAAHLIPWLNVQTLYINNEETLSEARARLLIHSPRLQQISYWPDHGRVPGTVAEEYPHIEFREYD